MSIPMLSIEQRSNRISSRHALGETENLPVADGTVDALISNCVINLSPNKKRVFKEAFRVLKPNRKLVVSDIILLRKLPEIIIRNSQAYIGCTSGAKMKRKYLQMIKNAGFQEVKIVEEKHFYIENMGNDPTIQTLIKTTKASAEEIKRIASAITCIRVSGIKPK
jgi:arsenite methyltransferase